MVSARRGAGRLGCLIVLLLLAGVVYFGVNVGEVYLRYYRYRDSMAQAARFASTRSDESVRRHLANVADSLGLPPTAGRVVIRRSSRAITIEANYIEHVELPGTVREFEFNPRVEQR